MGLTATANVLISSRISCSEYFSPTYDDSNKTSRSVFGFCSSNMGKNLLLINE